MANFKRVYFGSLFEFSQGGSEELIQEFCRALPEPLSAPFITYDKFNKVFCCDIDHSDLDQASIFVAQFRAYLDYHSKKKPDLVESPRIRPIDGTIAHDENPEAKSLRADLTQIIPEYEDSSDSDADSSLRHATAFWVPANGDVKILTTDYAEVIATSTGCHLFPEPTAKRVRLVNGNIPLALSKLRNLEPLMELAVRHRSGVNTVVNGSVTFFKTTGVEQAIKLARPSMPHCGYNRIMVDLTVQPLLDRIWLGELRLKTDEGLSKPLNLDLDPTEVSLTRSFNSCKIFEDAKIQSFGDPSVALARSTTKPAPANSDFDNHPLRPTKFLHGKDALRVADWSRNIDQQANPDVPPPEPASSDSHLTGRRRIVVEDSDSDSDSRSDLDPELRNNDKSQDTVEVSVLGSQQPQPQSRQRSLSISTESCNNSLIEAGHEEDSASKKQDTIAVAPSDRDLPKLSAYGHDENEPASQYVKRSKMSNNVFDLLGSELSYEISDEPENPQEHADYNSPLIELTSTDSSSQTPKPSEDMWQIAGKRTSGSPQTSKRVSSSTEVDFDDGTRPPIVHPQTKKGPFVRGRNLGRKHANHVRHGSHGANASSPVQALPRPIINTMPPPPLPPSRGGGNVRGRNIRGNPAERPEFSKAKQKLIDVNNDMPSVDLPMPPPGYSYRDNWALKAADEGLMDTPVDYTRYPAMLPSPDLSSNNTHSSSVGSAVAVSRPEYTPHFAVPRRNLRVIQDQTAAKLKREMKQSWQSEPERSSDEALNDLPPEKIASADESRSRVLHNTMLQQAGNPGKGKGRGNNKGKQETKKEIEARKAKAIADAHGPVPPNRATQATSKPAIDSERMSARKQRLLNENPVMAAMHPEVLRKHALRDSAASLQSELEPLFEAARAFVGQVQFEVQIGQTLIVQNDILDNNVLYRSKDWKSLLSCNGHSSVPVLFTNIVTSNGVEVDRVFSIQAMDGTSRLWEEKPQTNPSVDIEFLCQDKTGFNFKIVVGNDSVAETPNFRISKTQTVIGKVALHCPGNIWDACAVIHGSTRWLNVPGDVEQGIKQFMTSVYLTHDDSIKPQVFYRLPENNSFTIRDIVLKKVSIHNCLPKEHCDFRLRCTEVKALAHSAHPSDKKLFRSQELTFEDMVEKGRTHYELSISYTGLDKAFVDNQNLEVGELTPAAHSGKTLLNLSCVHQMVDVTTHMIEQIDWLGANNIGSIQRLHEDAQYKQTIVNASRPPQAVTQISQAVPMYQGVAGNSTILPSHPRTIVPTASGQTVAPTASNEEPRIIRGVRAGTNAELYQQDGQLFYYGLGGARIPVMAGQFPGLQDSGLNVSSGTIVPRDSASQVGVSSKWKPGVGGVGQSRFPEVDRGPGFW